MHGVPGCLQTVSISHVGEAPSMPICSTKDRSCSIMNGSIPDPIVAVRAAQRVATGADQSERSAAMQRR